MVGPPPPHADIGCSSGCELLGRSTSSGSLAVPAIICAAHCIILECVRAEPNLGPGAPGPRARPTELHCSSQKADTGQARISEPCPIAQNPRLGVGTPRWKGSKAPMVASSCVSEAGALVALSAIRSGAVRDRQ